MTDRPADEKLDLDALLAALDPEGRRDLPLEERTALLVALVERLSLRMFTTLNAEDLDEVSFRDRTVALGVLLDKFRTLTTRRKPGPVPKPKPAEEETKPTEDVPDGEPTDPVARYKACMGMGEGCGEDAK